MTPKQQQLTYCYMLWYVKFRRLHAGIVVVLLVQAWLLTAASMPAGAILVLVLALGLLLAQRYPAKVFFFMRQLAGC